MMHGRKTLVSLAGALVLCTGTTVMAVESSGTPYQGIVDRNVFGLKPPPDPESTKPPAPPPPKITLTGIFTMLGKKQAMMRVMVPPKPGAKQEEQSYILAVGQRDGDIEVLEIDEKAGTVKVDDFGTITNLNFQDNGVKLASGPAPGAPAPGAPPGVGGAIPQPGGGFAPPGVGYQRAIPTPRPMRTGAGANPAYPTSYGGGYGGASAQTTYSAVPIPGTGSATPVASTPGTVALNGLGASASTPGTYRNVPVVEPTSPEVQAIMQHTYYTEHGAAIEAGTMPPIPGGDPLANIGNSSTPTTTPPVNHGPQRLPNGQIIPGSF